MSRNNVKTPVTIISNVYHLQIIHKWSMVAMWSLNAGLFSRKTNACSWKCKRVHWEKTTCSICRNLQFLFLSLIRTKRTFLNKPVLLFISFSFHFIFTSQSTIYTCTPTRRYRHHSTKLHRAAAGYGVGLATKHLLNNYSG